jgi:hypothetical protein
MIAQSVAVLPQRQEGRTLARHTHHRRALIGRTEEHDGRRRLINSFVYGCTGKISGRLLALVALSAYRARENSRALVVIKTQKIDAYLAERGIHVPRPTRRGCPDSSVEGYNAGCSAGDRANFNRPVSGAAAARLEEISVTRP